VGGSSVEGGVSRTDSRCCAAKCGIGFEAGCKISGFGAQAHLRITFEARKLAIRKQEFAVLSSKISGFGAQAHLRITFEARKLAIRKQEFAVLSRSRTMATRMIGGFDMKETPV